PFGKRLLQLFHFRLDILDYLRGITSIGLFQDNRCRRSPVQGGVDIVHGRTEMYIGYIFQSQDLPIWIYLKDDIAIFPLRRKTSGILQDILKGLGFYTRRLTGSTWRSF